jgi:hypothetical protein
MAEMKRRTLVAWGAASLALAAGLSAALALRFRSGESGAPPLPLQAATTPTAAFDRQGRLWAVWIEDSNVVVGASTDRGRSFLAPVRITPQPEPVDANGEARPKLALGPNDEMFVSWTRTGARPYTGDIRFAASYDGGRTFSPPITVNDDRIETGHRFDALHVSRGGDVYVAWIDKRDLERATAEERPYAGAALYFALSTDGGRTFQPNRKIKDHVCECCRLAIDFDADDKPVMVWRDVIDGTTRDHGIVRFVAPATPAEPHRATGDGWKIDACPHHGPSLSIGADGTYHLVWFTGVGPAGPGSFYARSTDGGQTFSAPTRVAPPDIVGHAVVLSHGPRVVVAWKGSAGPDGRAVEVMESGDGGATWSAPRPVAWARGASDHPFLLAHEGAIFLSWHSAEGYRLVEVPPRYEVTPNGE